MSGACYEFEAKGTCVYGDNCRFAHGDQMPKRGVCYKFRDEGDCPFGNKCRFSHDVDEGGNGGGGEFQGEYQQKSFGNFSRKPRGECYNWKESGSCQYGDKCRFLHAGEPNGEYVQQAPQNRAPRAPGVCYDFRDNGECRFGENCKFSHSIEQ